MLSTGSGPNTGTGVAGAGSVGGEVADSFLRGVRVGAPGETRSPLDGRPGNRAEPWSRLVSTGVLPTSRRTTVSKTTYFSVLNSSGTQEITTSDVAFAVSMASYFASPRTTRKWRLIASRALCPVGWTGDGRLLVFPVAAFYRSMTSLFSSANVTFHPQTALGRREPALAPGGE